MASIHRDHSQRQCQQAARVSQGTQGFLWKMWEWPWTWVSWWRTLRWTVTLLNIQWIFEIRETVVERWRRDNLVWLTWRFIMSIGGMRTQMKFSVLDVYGCVIYIAVNSTLGLSITASVWTDVDYWLDMNTTSMQWVKGTQTFLLYCQ